MPSEQSQKPTKAFSVAEVVLRIKTLIEKEFPQSIWVEGELSNTSYASSGHIYFSLVDEKATDRYGQRLILPCAFFKGANQSLKFKLGDGMKVLCLGQVGTYEGRGNYQLKVLRVEPKGIGALQLAFEQLKKKLQAEGLFDETRKRPIPKFPNRICVITSPTGSAIHDMVSKLRGHFEITIVPAKVQGEGAADELSKAIKDVNRLKLADVLVIGRGGGSVEDLWAFNEESLARSIAGSLIPVISAVGHQDDWTISDYVADLRASTPTDAAKFLVNEQQLLLDEGRTLIEQLLDSMERFLEEESSEIDSLSERLRLLHPLNQLNDYERTISQRQLELVRLIEHSLSIDEQNVSSLAGRLEALSPLAVLARGYSITFSRPSLKVLSSASSVKPGDEIETKLAQGKIVSRVIETSEN